MPRDAGPQVGPVPMDVAGPADYLAAALPDVLRIAALAPDTVGGLLLRARPGPVREAVLAYAAAVLGPPVRLNPALEDEALYGGLDLTATLAARRPVRRPGLFDRDNTVFLMPMADRLSPAMAARLSAMLDAGRGNLLIALDEGASAEEAPPLALVDRLGLYLDTTLVLPSDLALPAPAPVVSGPMPATAR
ncbi:MAG: magnesium chelatase ATPase subunit D, partial [Pseudomonadota bacterium]